MNSAQFKHALDVDECPSEALCFAQRLNCRSYTFTLWLGCPGMAFGLNRRLHCSLCPPYVSATVESRSQLSTKRLDSSLSSLRLAAGRGRSTFSRGQLHCSAIVEDCRLAMRALAIAVRSEARLRNDHEYCCNAVDVAALVINRGLHCRPHLATMALTVGTRFPSPSRRFHCGFSSTLSVAPNQCLPAIAEDEGSAPALRNFPRQASSTRDHLRHGSIAAPSRVFLTSSWMDQSRRQDDDFIADRFRHCSWKTTGARPFYNGFVPLVLDDSQADRPSLSRTRFHCGRYVGTIRPAATSGAYSALSGLHCSGRQGDTATLPLVSLPFPKMTAQLKRENFRSRCTGISISLFMQGGGSIAGPQTTVFSFRPVRYLYRQGRGSIAICPGSSAILNQGLYLAVSPRRPCVSASRMHGTPGGGRFRDLVRLNWSKETRRQVALKVARTPPRRRVLRSHRRTILWNHPIKVTFIRINDSIAASRGSGRSRRRATAILVVTGRLHCSACGKGTRSQRAIALAIEAIAPLRVVTERRQRGADIVALGYFAKGSIAAPHRPRW
jgi:hypothetical protein